MPLSKTNALDAAHSYFPSFLRSRGKALLLNAWLEGRQYDIGDDDYLGIALDPTNRFNGNVFRPSNSNADVSDEYDHLESVTPSNFAGLLTATLAQTAHVEGIRLPGADPDTIDPAWATWQANRWDSKQTALHRTVIGLSTAYGLALPGKDPLTGNKMTRYLARSPITMAGFYDNDDDEWAMLGIEAEPYADTDGERGWIVKLYDEKVTHHLRCKGNGTETESWVYVTEEYHGLPVPPFARFVNRMNLEGQAFGEIEPVLPMLRRIDQNVFDRLIVQRFGAWKVRYVSGMAKPKTAEQERAKSIQLRIQDLLVSGDPKTKFGTLDASDPGVFSGVTDADLRMLAAITQTPPHHLLGLSSNLQAEALAAAEAGLTRKSYDLKMNLGESHEQMARMDAMYRGDFASAAATDRQVRWKDTESRSLTQAADALGKLADQLGIPVEMLWERVPNWTDSDSERAKKLIESGSIDALLQEFLGNDPTQQQQGGPGAPDNSGQ